MANEVYAAARAELTTLVSPRAAERMLDGALDAVNVSRDAVTARQMRALVTGPVQRDLRQTLPPDVSRQVLERVMERLRAMSPSTDRATAPRRSERTSPDAPAKAARESAVARVAERPRVSAAATAPAARRVADLHLDDAGVEQLARTFARLDDVIGVSVVRQGRVRFHRGEAIAAESAAALVPAAANALERGGPWRSYTLEHDLGHLFIVPVGRDHLVVVGRTGFNLGAVLTALATLEEEL